RSISHVRHGLATGLLNFRDHGLNCVGLYIRHNNRQAIGRQQASRCGTDTRGSARYQNRVAGKRILHAENSFKNSLKPSLKTCADESWKRRLCWQAWWEPCPARMLVTNSLQTWPGGWPPLLLQRHRPWYHPRNEQQACQLQAFQLWAWLPLELQYLPWFGQAV